MVLHVVRAVNNEEVCLLQRLTIHFIADHYLLSMVEVGQELDPVAAEWVEEEVEEESVWAVWT